MAVAAGSAGSSHQATVSTTVIALLRVAGAGLLGVTAGIHAYLWDVGYRTIPSIGVLFLLDVAGAAVLMLAVLIAPRRLTPVVAVLGALLELGTVGGLILATQVSLFGFMESTRATLYWQAVIVESVGAAVLAVLAVATYWQTRRGAAMTSWW